VEIDMVEIVQNRVRSMSILFCCFLLSAPVFLCKATPCDCVYDLSAAGTAFAALCGQASMEKAVKKECVRLQRADMQLVCISIVENVVSAAALLYGAYQFYKYYAGPDLSEQADYKDFLQQLYKDRGGEFTWQERPTFLKRIFRYAAVQGSASIIAALGTYALNKHQVWHMGKKQFSYQYLSMAKMVVEDQGARICRSIELRDMAQDVLQNELFAQGIINICAYLMCQEQKKSNKSCSNSFGSIYTIMRITLQKQALELAALVEGAKNDNDEIKKQRSMESIEKIVQSITTICEHVWKYEQNALNDAVRGNQEAIL